MSTKIIENARLVEAQSASPSNSAVSNAFFLDVIKVRCKAALISMSALFLAFPTPTQANLQSELTLEAPPCKSTKFKRPKLPPKLPRDSADWETDQEMMLDFNGDGWCDYAIGVPYPINGKMKSFRIEDILLLGGKNRWRAPLNGRLSYLPPLSELPPDWVIFQPDLTQIEVIYSRAGGAPYVLGIFAGSSSQLANFGNTGNNIFQPCGRDLNTLNRGAVDVHRWDPNVGTFKAIKEQKEREAVLKFAHDEASQQCPNQPNK